MRYIDNGGNHDPALNLALEEYALRQLSDEEPILLFYINRPSIIIGRNQNTAEEVNSSYAEANSIDVVRRLSGGGAVYHDLGNLNFSFVTKDDGESFHNFRKFTGPVVEALRTLGVDAELSGRNDIQVGERKISGNAMFATNGRMFSHGTLLFNSHMENVSAALNVNPLKFESKATKSIRSRVANITEFLRQPMSIEEFRSYLLTSIFEGQTPIPELTLTKDDWTAVRKLADDRYRNWDWNYGRSPAFNVQHRKRLAAGTFDIRLNVQESRITDAVIYGDFFGRGDLSVVIDRLKGVRYDRESVTAAIEDLDLSFYFGPIEREELLELLL